MVDLATFRTFPRASPGRRSEALVAERDVPVEKGALTDEALPTRFTHELRARRRAARTGMRQSEAWAEPEIVQPFAAPIPGPVGLAPALPEPTGAPIETVEESRAEYDEPAPLSTDHAETLYAAPAPSVADEVDDEIVHEPSPTGEREPPDPELIAWTPEPLIRHEEPAASRPETSFLEPEPARLPSPAPVDEVPAEQPLQPEDPAPVVTLPVPSPEPIIDSHEVLPAEEPWPAEPPPTCDDADSFPIAPPKPLEPEPYTPISAASEPEEAELRPVAVAEPRLRDYYGSESLTLDYRLLGLANPLVCTVTGKLGDATPIELTIGRTGIYRPNGFRPAPWSGFAYDVSPDGRTGLVLGTRILTARGEIPVEDLVPGDTALALRGPALLPIVWIGRSIADPPPVEILADAFGPGRPGKTLRVGAEHPIFMQSMPVLARDLVNGHTIRNLDTETAELFHIDVGLAEVLLAEGIPLSSGCR